MGRQQTVATDRCRPIAAGLHLHRKVPKAALNIMFTATPHHAQGCCHWARVSA
jgi:hypothetical protein